jgi:hypothetical protein
LPGKCTGHVIFLIIHSAHQYSTLTYTRPGLRERFVFSEHSYCTDLFWHLLNKSLRILWQYDFRDCYTMNRHTGTYAVSKAFENRISDISSWAMGPAFFQQWPELYADIPSFEASAVPMTRIDLKRPGSRPALKGRVGPTGSNTSEARSTQMRRYSMVMDAESVDVDGADISLLTRAAARGVLVGEGSNDDMEDDESNAQQPQQRGGSYIMPQQPLPSAAPSPMMQHKPSMMQEFATLRGVELLPRQDWIWMQPMIAEEQEEE